MIQKRLKEVLIYDKKTGIFRWKVRKSKNIKIGDIAGHIRKDKYIYIRIKPKLYKAHRLAWLYVFGKFPKYEIDHINQIRNDNKIKNLRIVTRKENCKNRAIHKNNTSGISGVSWCNKEKKWRANIMGKGIYKSLGYFTNKKNAKRARKKAKIKYGYHPNHA